MGSAIPVISAVLSLAGLVLLVVVLARLGSRRNAGFEKALREELQQARRDAEQSAAGLRAEISGKLDSNSAASAVAIGELGRSQAGRLDSLRSGTVELLDAARRDAGQTREMLESRMKAIEEANRQQLDEMRKVVDEKLQVTLQNSLTSSFGSVRENLEAVQKGLGEMQALATGVGDLKRVLTNVKARGTFGETQLGTLLDEMLTPEQYARNVKVRDDSNDMVEFAVKLPGRGDDAGSCVWLPIDAKFPQEDYLKLMDALEAGDQKAAEAASAALSKRVEAGAREIQEKYISPPGTTDFAILFLPTEGLYSEVLRRPGMVERMQSSYRILVAGPTTLLAILTSLRMGFRTLAIEKRSSEVWKILAGVKREVDEFEKALERAQKHVLTASNSLDATSRRSRVLRKQLRSVESGGGDSIPEIPGSVEEATDGNGGGAEEAAGEPTR